MTSRPGRHRRQQPPTWAGIAPFRWHITALLIVLIILILGGLL